MSLAAKTRFDWILEGYKGLRITEVGVTLVQRRRTPNPEPTGFISVVFNDGLVTDGIRFLEDPNGEFMVSMPNKEKIFRCTSMVNQNGGFYTCNGKNAWSNNFCGKCGKEIFPPRLDAKARFFDITHPIDEGVRAHIEDVCLFGMEYIEGLIGTSQEVPFGSKLSIMIHGKNIQGGLKVTHRIIYPPRSDGHTTPRSGFEDRTDEEGPISGYNLKLFPGDDRAGVA